MTLIPLSPIDLSVASLLVLLLAIFNIQFKLGLTQQILIAALRTTIQLLLVGFVLKSLFAQTKFFWIFLMSMVMLFAAGREVTARQKHRFIGWKGFGLGTIAMFFSSFIVAIITLTTIISPAPWYKPQYAIPLLGMLLGNTMTGIALSLNHLTKSAFEQKDILEQRLLLGQSRQEAILEIRQESMRTGMIPTINGMAAAGIVSLPGMMSGQILAGNSPSEAVKYQILIMFLITAGTGFGVILSLFFASYYLFDPRHRLRLDHLKEIKKGRTSFS